MLRELSVRECEDLLVRNSIGRIGMRDADGVYIVPISYAFASGAIHAHAAPGRKVQLMRLWPHVCLQVDEVADAAHWQSVVVHGRYEELQHEEEKHTSRLALLRAFAGNPTSVTAGHGHRTALADAVIFRVRIEELSGRAEGM